MIPSLFWAPRQRAKRASPLLIPNPVPPGWSGEEGVALTYRFLEAPQSLLAWAQTEEVFDKQQRDQVWPKVLTILLPDETPVFKYASELDALDRMDISVGNCTEVILYRWQLKGVWKENEAVFEKSGSDIPGDGV